jgi:tRNA (cmo5U34)-methyltransferase
MDNPTSGWTETDSRDFLDLADVAVPGRQEQVEMLLRLVPASPDEALRAVELACGEGLLAERLLEYFSRLQLTAFDGSDVMLEASRSRLQRFGGRVDMREFQLASKNWLEEIEGPLRCVVSSLAIHHLTDEEKRSLYNRVAARLEPGGAILIADAVQPDNPTVRRAIVHWHRIAREQSDAFTGSNQTYQRLVAKGWAPPETEEPEPGEMPARLYDHLAWLKDAGRKDVGCFWMRGGHAIYGGYR